MAKDFIAKQDIESEAISLIYAAQEDCGTIAVPPVPISEILECHLQFNLEFTNLQRKYHSNDILAEAYLASRKVVIDESLDPYEFPDMEGRFHFTLAHEIGHWALHRKYFEEATPDMFGDARPSVVCRSSHKDPREYQADSFAGYLLMPDDMLRKTWREFFHDERPLNVNEEIESKRKLFNLDEKAPPPSCDLAKELALLYKVSAQAMQIRLSEIKLLELKPPETSLL